MIRINANLENVLILKGLAHWKPLSVWHRMEMSKLQVASIHDEIASQAISILGNKSHEEVLFFSRFEISVNR